MNGTFVIQLHQVGDGYHYDLMLETGEALVTFQLPVLPGEIVDGESVEAARLPDHRREYLTYEGPVSGDRGTVRIVDRGRYDAPVAGPDCWDIRLVGRADTCRLALTGVTGDQFRLIRIAFDPLSG